MSIVKRNNLLFPSLMNEFFKPDWFGGMETLNSTVPAVNIKENEKDFELELAIPGFKKDDFNIEIDENILTISSQNGSENETGGNNYTRREFSYAEFKRVFTLPDTIDEAKIKRRAVRDQSRGGHDAASVLALDQETCPQSGHPKKHFATFDAPFICDASVESWGRFARGADAVGPFRFIDHSNLHPHCLRSLAGTASKAPPQGMMTEHFLGGVEKIL